MFPKSPLRQVGSTLVQGMAGKAETVITLLLGTRGSRDPDLWLERPDRSEENAIAFNRAMQAAGMALVLTADGHLAIPARVYVPPSPGAAASGRHGNTLWALMHVEPGLLAMLMPMVAYTCSDSSGGVPMPWEASSVLAAAPTSGWPICIGVAVAPAIRPDGSLITKLGYDRESGRYVVIDPDGTRRTCPPQTQSALNCINASARPLEWLPKPARDRHGLMVYPQPGMCSSRPLIPGRMPPSSFWAEHVARVPHATVRCGSSEARRLGCKECRS